MDEFERNKRLRRETAGQRIALIENDIDTGVTFLRLAVMELAMSHPARVDELLAKARMAYTATAKFLAEVEDPVEWLRLHDKHQALGDAIGEVESKRRQLQEKP